MTKTDPVVISAEDIWGAAAFATRINEGYLKEDEYSWNTHRLTKHANRDVAKKALREGTVTEADRKEGVEARHFLHSRLTMKALSKRLTDFEAGLAKAVSLDEFVIPQDRMMIGIVNSQIVSYHRQLREESMTKDAVWGYVSEVGMRVDIEATPTARFWVDRYDTFRYNSITKDGYKASFYHRDRLEVGRTVKVRGTVKKHADNTTFLNRVKIEG